MSILKLMLSLSILFLGDCLYSVSMNKQRRVVHISWNQSSSVPLISDYRCVVVYKLPTIQDVQPICSLSQRSALQQQRYEVGERFTQQRVLMREKRQVYEQLLNGLQQNSDDNVYKLNVIEAKRDLERCTATLLSLERWLLSLQK